MRISDWSSDVCSSDLNNIYATVNLPGANRWGSVGRAQPGADMRIAADGEIQFKHAAVTKGYYNEPDKTAELFTADGWLRTGRSEEHTSELQSLMRISYAVFCLKKHNSQHNHNDIHVSQRIP